MSRELRFIPQNAFERVRSLKVSAVERTQLFATLARINTLYMIARAGSGHIGSSFSSLDIVSWLFLNEIMLPSDKHPRRPHDIYFSSKGHDVPGLYAVMIGLGLLSFDKLHALRRLNGLPGHPDVGTPFIEANTGSLGMGISKAKGMAIANRLNGRAARIFVLLGDGELQEGQIWESLGSAVRLGLGELTVMVDHNKVQSDTLVSDTADLGDLDGKFSAFGWHVGRCDGHRLEQLADLLRDLRAASDQPKVIIADTIKGKGVSFMEHTAMGSGEPWYRYHSGAPTPEDYERAVDELLLDANHQLELLSQGPLDVERIARPEPPAAHPAQRLITSYSTSLIEQAGKNPRIVALDADLVLDTGLIPFRERFPHRFVECGIAEQDMVSQASGMALMGLLPVVHSFACFLSSRPNEQIYNNASERCRVIYVGSLAGVLPGGPGHSHQAVRDIAALGAVPGLVAIEPGCEKEVAAVLDYCLNRSNESCYIRLVSIPYPVNFDLPKDYELAEGCGNVLRQGEDAIVFGYGPVLLSQALSAADMLAARHGIELTIINLPWLNRFDRDWLAKTIGSHRYVFTLDNHYISGGQGERIAAGVVRHGLDRRPLVTHFGITDFPVCGTNEEVLRFHGLDAPRIGEAIVAAMRLET